MRNLLLCLLIPFLALAQPRNNRELPIFEPLPYFTVGDSITGWSLSSDGQWVSRPQTIPPIGISRNEEFYNREENAIGIDNINQLIGYKVKYGSDTLICLVKVYTDGAYRYPNRRRGWKNFTAGYYWLVRYQDLKSALNYFDENDTGDTFVLRIKSLEGRQIKEIEDEEDILKKVVSTTIIKPNFDRNLVLTIQSGSDKNLIRLHMCSLHVVFNDVEGTRSNFTRRGKSVYGSVRLFDYMYFEMDRKDFYSILDLDSNLDLLLEEELNPIFDVGSPSDSMNYYSDSLSIDADTLNWD